MLLDGINHIAWISKDAARLKDFYASVFAAEVGPTRPHGESPGETILYEGRTYKVYQGMGSLSAMSGGRGDRYFQEGVKDLKKLVAEGIEARVPYKGLVANVIYQLVGGLRAGMGYCGVSTIDDLRTKTRFIKITPAGLRESHPHDVTITKEAPNYEIR